MNGLDILFLVLLFIPAFMGFRKGLIKAVLSLVGLIIGVLIASNLYEPVSGMFGFFNNENAAKIVAFLLILTLVLVAAFFLARLLKSILSITMMGWVDNVGGAFLGFLTGFIFLSAILATWVKLFGSGMVTDSFIAQVMLDYFPLILGLLPASFDGVQDFFQS